MTLFFFSSEQDPFEQNSELGLIPRICQTMFAKMQQSTDNSTTFRTEASYLEIYNEKVKDLLGPDANGTHGLKVCCKIFTLSRDKIEIYKNGQSGYFLPNRQFGTFVPVH